MERKGLVFDGRRAHLQRASWTRSIFQESNRPSSSSMENGRRDLFGSCSRNDFHLPNRGAAFERTKLLCGEPCGQRLRRGLARLGGDASSDSHFETLAPLNLKGNFYE